MKIGISKSDTGWDKYIAWLEYFNSQYIILDYKDKNDLSKLDDCSGLILTGGVDIYPEIYFDWDPSERKGTYIPERDGFELNLLERAINNKIPILGICRGCQLINVHCKGNLIFDLETQRNVNHRKISDVENRIHSINILDDTLLKNIVKSKTGDVTSSHHQAIDRPGEGLIINSKSPDGIIEGIEFEDKTNKAFMIGIQWHPERLSDFDSPFSKNIIARFAKETNLK